MKMHPKDCPKYDINYYILDCPWPLSHPLQPWRPCPCSSSWQGGHFAESPDLHAGLQDLRDGPGVFPLPS